MKKVLIALLIIIVLAVGGAYAYLALSTGEYDDIPAILAEAPMPSAERYRINTSDRTVSIAINKADLYRLVSQELGGDIMGSLNSALSAYDLSADALGVRTEGTNAEVDLKLKYKNFLPIPLRINAVITESNGVVGADIDTVSIGKYITFDSVVLTERAGDITIPTVDLKELSPLLKDLSKVTFGSNSVDLTIPYPMGWLKQGIDSAMSVFNMILDFVDPDELDTPVPAMFDSIDGDDTGLVRLLETYEGGLANLKATLLGLNGSYSRTKFFDEDTKQSYDWLLPEIKAEASEAVGKAIIAEYQAMYDERTGILAKAWQYILDAYASGEIKEKQGKFIYPEKDNAELVLSELDVLKGTESWLDLDAMRIVLGENPGDYALNQVPKGNTVTALILKTHTDRPVICYQYTSSIFKIRSITQKEYDALMEAARVPVYDIGEHTTAR